MFQLSHPVRTLGALASFVAAFGALAIAQVEEPPAVIPGSLKDVPVPLPDNLGDFVDDLTAAKQLGKALFWDTRLGSDGKTACATCHFSAGVDPRFVNQLNPASDGVFEETNSGNPGGPNYTPVAADWPHRRFADPNDNESLIVDDYFDTFSSQGVHHRMFTGLSGGAVDNGTSLPDPDGFRVGTENTRRVEPRNAPTVINAIFNHRSFSDGRANHFFNGENIWGNQDPNARILVNDGGGAVPTAVLLNNASLASQALGPPLSGFEMSWVGRTWNDIGRKMLPMRPLEGQVVALDDSLLGPLAAPAVMTGLTTATYEDMVKAAFNANLWNDNVGVFDGYSQLEANFDFFFGLSVMLYESCLVSDDSRFDQYMDGGGEGGTNSDVLTDVEKEGLDVFANRGDCLACHTGAEFAGAQVSTLIPPEGLLERMGMENTGAEGCFTYISDPYPLPPGYDNTGFDPRGQIMWVVGPAEHDPAPEAAAPGEEGEEPEEPEYDMTCLGPTIAQGFLFGSTPAGYCGDFDDRYDLVPFTHDPYAQADPHAEPHAEAPFGVEIRMRKKDDECRIEMEVCIETGFPGILPGTYSVVVAGKVLGQIEMSEANPPAVYDNGFYNIGTKPTEMDAGAGGDGPLGPISLSRRVQLGEDIGQITGLDIPMTATERVAVNGAFRAGSIRNIELTGPYMHTGSLLTLEQVVAFYGGGAHFMLENIDDLDPEVAGIGGLDPERAAALVAFMKTLTDERVRNQEAPFDHPSIDIPVGHILGGVGPEAADECITIPAVGAGGGAPIQPFHTQVVPTMTCLAPIAPFVIEETATQVTSTAFGGLIGAATRVDLGHRDRLAAMDREITMFLDTQPAEDVTITISTTSDADVFVRPASLVFTPTNYAQPRTVRVYAWRDDEVEHVESVDLLFQVASLDARFSGMPMAPVRVDVIDFDDDGNYLTKTYEAESGELTAPMVVVDDASASGGSYVTVPNASTNFNPATGGGRCEIDFLVTEAMAAAGEIRIWVLADAPSWTDNTTWVKVDDIGLWDRWIMTPSSGWSWEETNDDGGAPNSWTLESGMHTLNLVHHKDGMRIDRIIVSADPSFDPNTP